MSTDSVSNADRMFSSLLSMQDMKASIANSTLSVGLGYLQQKKYSQAIAAFRQTIAYDFTNKTAYNYMANAYLQQNNPSDAIKAYKMSLQLDSTQSDIYVSLANVYMTQNNNIEAEKAYKAAEKADPTSNSVPYTYGLFLVNNNRPSDALTEFKKAAKLSPNDGNVYYGLGLAYNKLGDYSNAVDQLKKAVSLKKNFDEATYQLAEAYIGVGKTDDAKQQLTALKNMNTSNSTSLAAELSQQLKQPKISGFAVNRTSSSLLLQLSANSPLYMLDPTLATPNSSKDFSVKIQFDSEMDATSVMNIANWSINKATGGVGGIYNNGVYLPNNKDAGVQPIPKSVMYDATTMQATINFTINQNKDGNATIDPSHLVFRFMGKDTSGKQMDSTADQIDGFAGEAF